MTITIFLADDHTIVRDGLRAILAAHADLKVIGEAGSGHETVRRVAQLRPDIVILDITVPDLNGIEAAWEIAVTCPATQIIILSMYATPEHIYQALKAGVCGYLLKDAAGAELIQAIRTVSAGYRYLSQDISDQVIDDYVRQRHLAEAADPLTLLSPRERQILQLTLDCKSNEEIADLLALSPKTTQTYRARLMRKLGVNDLPALVKFAIRRGLTSLE
jgi:DNA-binding NarL/FixJ family response regulator